MTIWYGLIRHAVTAWNRERRLQGSLDIPLSAEGAAQAKDWAQTLEDFGFERIVASPLARAAETAAILSRGLGLTWSQMPGLAEADFGAWEGRTFEEIARGDPEGFKRQTSTEWDFAPPGGESRKQVLNRARRTLEELKDLFPGRMILLVTHQTVIKTLMYKAMENGFPGRGLPRVRGKFLHLVAPDLSRAMPDYRRLPQYGTTAP
jgi:probable phosphoglycerate mutase